ncbi:MAG: hypothetical protein QOJ20_4366 [Mycobacterium sp.]|nr:hypothetical protein [Mycobacterium sp.]MDT5283171.1 hypothetical protein [Mycobacterium sp.]
MTEVMNKDVPERTFVESLPDVQLELPKTLHGQLYLLAYDRFRCRVDGDTRWRFGLALRTAMLTDLYLAGHVEDVDGRPSPVVGARPGDPLLRAALDEVGATEQTTWPRAVAHDQRKMPGLVRAQLEAGGWLSVRRRRILGIVPTTRVLLGSHDMVSALAGQVAAVLRDAIAGRPADERLFTVGLIGALGELPTVFAFDEASRHYSELEELVYQGIPPITGMRGAIDAVHGAMSANDRGPYST